MANAHNLEQLIKGPTRITENSRSLIDLIFTSSSHHLSDHEIINLPLSDHSMVYCVVKVGMKKAPGRIIEYRSFKSYDKGNFINDLKCIDWNFLDNELEIDVAISKFNVLFTSVANSHAPIKKSRGKRVS